MEDKLFDLVGLGVPFYLAAATYAVFSWLDGNASDDATKVVTAWLRGRSQHKPDLGNLIITSFDRIYTSPLLTSRAFRRSAAISSIIWLVVFLIPWLVSFYRLWSYGVPIMLSMFYYETLIADLLGNLCIIILTDYASLLIVRRFLTAAEKHPIRASLLSSAIGLLVVMTGIFLFSLILTAVSQIENYYAILVFGKIGVTVDKVPQSVQHAWLAPAYFFSFVWGSSLTAGMAPAFVIHLWLPLFALSSLVARLIFWIFRAVEWAQWFLKQGDAHPLKVIGFVATIIVFGSAMLVKEGWALLSVLERS